MILTFAAVGAVVAALFETSIGPYLSVGGGHPHFVLVFTIVWTVVAGIDGGLVWAFVGGLALDFLAPRPLGSSAFVLLVIVAIAALIARVLMQLRLRFFAPVVAVAILSPLYSLTLVVVDAALTGPLDLKSPIAVLAPGVVLDAIAAAVLGPLAMAFRTRLTEQERLDW
jgi:rod shape-determining protein MreD